MKPSVFLLIIMGILTLSCSSRNKEGLDLNKESEEIAVFKDWEERTPESQGVDSEKLEGALNFLKKESGSDGINEVVIIRNGYMIYKGSRIDSVHRVWSISKVFASTCLGLLIEDGKCKIGDFAKDYEPRLRGAYPEYESITLHHFATMTSGYDGKGGDYGSMDPYDGSPVPFTHEKPAFAPGTKFSYWDDAMCMFGLVLTKIANAALYDMFKTQVADPIGINPNKWYWEDFGEIDGRIINKAQLGVFMSARELVRFGLLYLNNGNWDGKQIISEEWILEATKVQVPNTMPGRTDSPRQKSISLEGPGSYGYHWWTNGILSDGTRFFPDAPDGTYWRSGWPKQRLFIIPEWNMVIVRLGRDSNKVDLPVDVRYCWNTTLNKIGDAIIDEMPENIKYNKMADTCTSI